MIYTQTARFDASARALSETELFRMAPSIFARDAHHSRSERFAPVPTIEMVRGLAKEGFSVVGAQQSLARVEDKKPYTKHLLRMRRLDDTSLKVGDSVFEILLRNANDGTSAYELLAGMFRICCLNSLVAATADMDKMVVRHSGNAVEKVIEGTYKVLERREKVMAAAQDWGQIPVSERVQLAFAKGAAVERWGQDEETGNVLSPVPVANLLNARRPEDQGNDLWKVFNRVQENVMQGGLAGLARTGRRLTTRQVKGIDETVKVNRGLWAMAEYLADRPHEAAN